MQTNLSTEFKATEEGKTVDRILRSCVHCGFCTATCPTYQVLGNELDSPRGRIYLIKQMFEKNEVSQATLQHLDRCLTCRSCETTCPSGVEYHTLLDIGKQHAIRTVKRPLAGKLFRKAIVSTLENPKRFKILYQIGQQFRLLLPPSIKKNIRPKSMPKIWPDQNHSRKVILFEGCVQPTLTPEVNDTIANLLNKLEIQVIRLPEMGCCGAMHHHTDAPDLALQRIKANIDAWWPHINRVEAIITSASGCGVFIKDYEQLLSGEPEYLDKAKLLEEKQKDIAELLADEDLSTINSPYQGKTIRFHPPCTLQHGQKINGVVEKILGKLNLTVTLPEDSHLCCGSAGTYSILQKTLSTALKERKTNALMSNDPDLIVTANIGCQLQLQSSCTIPVKHWVELLSD
ncbi:MAG: glycolate oxidase subunit GlcF [Methylococcales bacterium]|jgi:glycolate oxidase iron-sulfur subunit|nr:glycolate oxidase subunit GlcF [Methylococcales bacterium]MBT7443947.1 glycolate oxidase subunit GlcF [Methylococcales bacterium]